MSFSNLQLLLTERRAGSNVYFIKAAPGESQSFWETDFGAMFRERKASGASQAALTLGERLESAEQEVWNDLLAQLREMELIDEDAYRAALEQSGIRAEIVRRLDGVPAETVSIPPSVMEKMQTDRVMYDRVMSGIDEYVRNYRTYNKAGNIDLSFHVTEEGGWVIRGKDKWLSERTETWEEADRKERASSAAVDDRAAAGADGIDDNAYSLMAALYGHRVKRTTDSRPQNT